MLFADCCTIVIGSQRNRKKMYFMKKYVLFHREGKRYARARRYSNTGRWKARFRGRIVFFLGLWIWFNILSKVPTTVHVFVFPYNSHVNDLVIKMLITYFSKFLAPIIKESLLKCEGGDPMLWSFFSYMNQLCSSVFSLSIFFNFCSQAYSDTTTKH